jgi:hypothetical protein
MPALYTSLESLHYKLSAAKTVKISYVFTASTSLKAGNIEAEGQIRPERIPEYTREEEVI